MSVELPTHFPRNLLGRSVFSKNSVVQSMSFPWVFGHMNLPLVFHGDSMELWRHGFTMDNPWILHGEPMANSYGQIPMENSWISFMKFSWDISVRDWLGLRRGVFTCVGWQITLCDPIWQVTPRVPINSHTLLIFFTLPSMSCVQQNRANTFGNFPDHVTIRQNAEWPRFWPSTRSYTLFFIRNVTRKE